VDNIGAKTGLRFFPFIFVLFSFLLCLNLIGIVPYRFTVTSHLIITLCLSLGVFIGRTFIIFREHKIEAFGFFLPSGIPLALIPIIVIIEVISYFLTIISLGVRLFANIIRGHILLKVLTGFA
jgi:ATP synthase subunit 6